MLLVKWIQIDKAIKECQKSNQLIKLKMIKQGEGNAKIKKEIELLNQRLWILRNAINQME